MFTPQGAQKKKTLARVQTRTEINEVESAKSELTYPDKGASRKRERADEAPSYSSRRSARVELRANIPTDSSSQLLLWISSRCDNFISDIISYYLRNITFERMKVPSHEGNNKLRTGRGDVIFNEPVFSKIRAHRRTNTHTNKPSLLVDGYVTRKIRQ